MEPAVTVSIDAIARAATLWRREGPGWQDVTYVRRIVSECCVDMLDGSPHSNRVLDLRWQQQNPPFEKLGYYSFLDIREPEKMVKWLEETDDRFHQVLSGFVELPGGILQHKARVVSVRRLIFQPKLDVPGWAFIPSRYQMWLMAQG